MNARQLTWALPLVFTAIASLSVAACGGGGGGGGDEEATLLLEMSVGGGGSGGLGPDTDPHYVVFARFGATDTELPLAVVATDDDGVVFDADPLHPAFAALVAMLTNGQDDPLNVVVSVFGSPLVFSTTDANTFIQRSAALSGPDLFAATITQVQFRVDAVEIEIVGTSESHSINGALIVSGLPN